eukprot:1186787-Prorocentrum_minimum.AAC.1
MFHARPAWRTTKYVSRSPCVAKRTGAPRYATKRSKVAAWRCALERRCGSGFRGGRGGHPEGYSGGFRGGRGGHPEGFGGRFGGGRGGHPEGCGGGFRGGRGGHPEGCGGGFRGGRGGHPEVFGGRFGGGRGGHPEVVRGQFSQVKTPKGLQHRLQTANQGVRFLEAFTLVRLDARSGIVPRTYPFWARLLHRCTARRMTVRKVSGAESVAEGVATGSPRHAGGRGCWLGSPRDTRHRGRRRYWGCLPRRRGSPAPRCPSLPAQNIVIPA